MNQNNSLAIILAAGKGTRMNENIPKPIVKVNNAPIISWLINDFKNSNTDIAIIINPLDQLFFNDYKKNVEFVYQEQPKGTGHAVQQASNLIKKYKHVYVFVGDCPFVGIENIGLMYHQHNINNNDLTILSANFENKLFPYARIIRDKNSSIISCVEEIDATYKQKKIKELFGSHYLFKSEVLLNYLDTLRPNPKTGEIYFTDIINNLICDKKQVGSLIVNDWRRLVGLNTKKELEWIESQRMI
tara:strand:- start:13113 stop:13844 length:732 start_codon:yes stop_codon:yes gene_type:complete